jgi:competence protein ComFC
VIHELLKLLFPPQCRVCGKVGANYICESCFNGFPRFKTYNTCRRCGKPLATGKTGMPVNSPAVISGKTNNTACRECINKEIYFTTVSSAGSYEGTLKEAIRQLKYKNGKLLAPRLALFMKEAADGFIDRSDFITYVPMTKRKELHRGYNQARLLADELSLMFRKPCRNILLRLKDNEEQNKSSLIARAQNVKGAFEINKRIKSIINHTNSILLIDDVFTTGSTVNECARILRETGIPEVHVLTLARTPLLKG